MIDIWQWDNSCETAHPYHWNQSTLLKCFLQAKMLRVRVKGLWLGLYRMQSNQPIKCRVFMVEMDFRGHLGACLSETGFHQRINHIANRYCEIGIHGVCVTICCPNSAGFEDTLRLSALMCLWDSWHTVTVTWPWSHAGCTSRPVSAVMDASGEVTACSALSLISMGPLHKPSLRLAIQIPRSGVSYASEKMQLCVLVPAKHLDLCK